MSTRDEPCDLRYQRVPGGRWYYGWFRGRTDSGDVDLITEREGASRTMLPGKIEFKIRGPKKGVAWVSAEGVERPMSPE